MRVAVVGLWHQGTVIAACFARGGHHVVGVDFDAKTIADLSAGRPPLFEPGLEEEVRRELASGRLRFTAEPAAVGEADIVWVAYDTPVDMDDNADVDFVCRQVEFLFPHLRDGSLLLVSAQLPVGTTRRLREKFRTLRPSGQVIFGYSPENLRLGRAIEVFTNPDRFVVGVHPSERSRVAELLRPFSERIEWMSVESAEMTKHAINAFLATSVTFINELAVICEAIGADAKEVERALKSEQRIGPNAYLSPGGPFAGGTLARDITFLTQVAAKHNVPSHLLASVRTSNDSHKLWVRRKLQALMPVLCGQTVAIWGLTYKPGTDTLRRSAAIELCHWLVGQGVKVQVHDPIVKALPHDLEAFVALFESPLAAVKGAQALVVATEWPTYREVTLEGLLAAMRSPVVVDANRFLDATIGHDARLRYLAVGKSN